MDERTPMFLYRSVIDDETRGRELGEYGIFKPPITLKLSNLSGFGFGFEFK